MEDASINVNFIQHGKDVPCNLYSLFRPETFTLAAARLLFYCITVLKVKMNSFQSLKILQKVEQV